MRFPRTVTALVLLLGVMSTTRLSHAITVVRVPLKGQRQINDIRQQGIEILAMTRYGLDLLADDKQLAYLQSRNYPSTVLVSEEVARATMGPGPDLGLYHTYAEMESVLTDLSTTYPSITQLSVIGTSIEGRNIYALKISDNPTVDEAEPEALFMGNLHARELMAVELPLRFGKHLVESYGIDPTITGYVDTREIWVVPMINPDGHVYVEAHNSGNPGTWWRLNRRLNANLTRGVDLNRNFSYFWGYDDIGSSPVMGDIVYRGPSPASEPETQAIQNFVDSREFTIWLSYHSYGELLLYPWGYAPLYTSDHDVYLELGNRLAQSNGYLAGNTAMGAIYLVNGDSDDWGYGAATHNKIFAFTPEVNSFAQGGFGPPDTLIAPTFALNLDMNMGVLEYAANPYQVVGPYAPTQSAITTPYGNNAHRLNWSGNDPQDPNPVSSYTIESCWAPSWVTDHGAGSSMWSLGGFTVSGSGMSGGGYFSGSGDNLFNSMEMARLFHVDASHQALTFWINYDIETDWDYGYVEASGDGGLTWSTIAGNITTATNPNGNNRGNGITGLSGGWVSASFSLAAYLGTDVLVRISYVTDGAVINPGMWLDDIDPVATCGGGVTEIATGVPGNSHDVVPTQTGTFQYRVRAVDSESDLSRWSNGQDFIVTTLTGVGSPRVYRTQLGPNYPNPFNPATMIPYVVGGKEDATTPRQVSLRIYDVTGALVATLVDGARRPGLHEVPWSGQNEAGEPVGSGIYFSRLRVDGVAPLTAKLVLLK